MEIPESIKNFAYYTLN